MPLLGLHGDQQVFSKGDAEIGVPGGVDRLFDPRIAKVAREEVLDLPEAVVDILAWSLEEHLDRAVGEVPDEARDIVLLGDLAGRIVKTHALHVAPEDDVLGRLLHACSGPRIRWIGLGDAPPVSS